MQTNLSYMYVILVSTFEATPSHLPLKYWCPNENQPPNQKCLQMSYPTSNIYRAKVSIQGPYLINKVSGLGKPHNT